MIEADPAATLEFVLTLLAVEPAAIVRAEILDELEDVPDPRIGPALEGS